MGPSEVFLSHSDRNRDAATKLADVLARHGVPVWYSRKDVLGAQRELLFALQDDRYENRIVPILYQPCNLARLSWTLTSFQMVDLTGDFHDGCRELLRTWGIGYRLSL